MKKNKYLLIGMITALLLTIIAIIYFNRPIIEFKEEIPVIELKSQYDPKSFISHINRYKIEDVIIDQSKVNIDKLGLYTIKYQIKDKTYNLKVEVVDTVAPTYDVKDIDIDLGMELDINSIVSNIKDDTQTKSYFQQDYNFKEPGTQEIVVVVEDEAGNKTEKSVNVNIVRDDEKPTLQGLKDLTVTQNQKVDYLKNITAKDNRDPQPQIHVDSSQVNLSKPGQYKIIYTVEDRSQNKETYVKYITVLEKKPEIIIPPTGNKTVYLTFDDGPSANTAKILDILASYNAKATFFVTGNGQKYNHLIKRANDEGHTIGLHTYTHEYSQLYASVDAYFHDLNQIGEMVKNQIGFVPKYIRFPGGSSNAISKRYTPGIMTILTKEVQARGYQYYDWNAGTGDADGNNVPVSKIVRNATQSHANNIMILGHDTQAKNTTVQALPQIIEHYQALGYTFKGIDDSTFTPHHRVNN